MCFEEEEERGWRDIVKEKSWEGEEQVDDIGEGDDCKASCLGFCFSEKVWELFFTCCRCVSMMIEEEKSKREKGFLCWSKDMIWYNNIIF